MMNIGKRLQLTGLDLRAPLWKFSGGHGGDEYGNCSVYFRCLVFGVVFFWDPHFQRKVELPLSLPNPDEVAQWRRWYCEKFEDGDDLWAS